MPTKHERKSKLNKITVLFGCFLLFPIFGCGIGKRSAESGPEKINVAGPYTHKGTKMVFPEKFENLFRTGVTSFDQKEDDIGVGYSGNDLPLEITVFVYPAPKSVSFAAPEDAVERTRAVLFLKHYEALKGEILRSNASAVFLSEGDFELIQGRESYAGKLAKYKLNYRYALGERPSLSSLYLFQIGKWLVSYRITYLDSFEAEFDPMIRSLMNGLKFPPRP
jgi:hypothetical protein